MEQQQARRKRPISGKLAAGLRQLSKARTGHEQTALRRQIETTDAEIDRLVYNLYGLTAKEIRIVDDATR